jgi:hypothetical protein
VKVLVTGGRSLRLPDQRMLEELLTGLHAGQPITLVIEGGASGADSVGRSWALRNGVRCITLYADWNSGYRLAAGHRRNEEMLLAHEPDLVVAAPGKAGTLDCVGKAKALGIPVLAFGPPDGG